MLKWVMGQMMKIEAEAKVGAEKGRHTRERAIYFSGERVRRVDTTHPCRCQGLFLPLR